MGGRNETSRFPLRGQNALLAPAIVLSSDGSPERTRTLIFFEFVRLHFAFTCLIRLHDAPTERRSRCIEQPILVSDLKLSNFKLKCCLVCAALSDFYPGSPSFSVPSPPLSYTL